MNTDRKEYEKVALVVIDAAKSPFFSDRVEEGTIVLNPKSARIVTEELRRLYELEEFVDKLKQQEEQEGEVAQRFREMMRGQTAGARAVVVQRGKGM